MTTKAVPETTSTRHSSQEVHQFGPAQETARVPGGPRGRSDHQGHEQPQGQTAHARAVEGGASYRRGAGPGGLRPLTGCRTTYAESPRRQGQQSRNVPMHRELQAALRSALSYGSISQGKLVDVHPSTAWRWVRAAVTRTEELGAVAPGRRIGTHTLRHSYARHLLMNGIQINYLSRWLGHSSIQTTLIYLELVPDPSGSLDRVP